jgi:mercuric ion transport protein
MHYSEEAYMNSIEGAEIACVPSVIPAAARPAHFALARDLLEVRAEERMTLPDGYAIRFRADALEAVARFIENERKCCPFLTFALTLDPDCGPLWLRITGPEGTRAVLDAELNLNAHGCDCGCSGATTEDTTPKAIKCAQTSCGRSKVPTGTPRVVKWTAAGGILASLGVCAACCLLPFILLSVGAAGVWVSALDSFAPYKWIFIALTAAFLGYGFYAVYWKPTHHCAAGAACADRGSPRSVRISLWVATILAIGGIVFEYFEPVLKASH